MLIFLLSFLSGVEVFAEVMARINYDELFPLYIESCASSRIKKIGEGAGAPWGHSVVYVKGMCRDKLAPYPRVKVCEDDVDLKNHNSGTLVSVEPAFNNTNWVAIEGRNFAFNGGLQPDEVVNTEVLGRTRKTALESGAFRGVSLHKAWRKLNVPELTEEENIVNYSLGTHYAIDFGRSSYCNLVPITRTQLESVVVYLNNTNRPYVEKEKKFRWDVFNNNCVHIVRNVLAAAGIGTYKPIGRHYPLGIFDVLIPGRYFVDLAKKDWSWKSYTVTHLFRNKIERKNLEQFGMPSIVHGLLTHIDPMRIVNNEYFSSSPDLALGVIRYRKDVLAQVLSGNPMNDLKENLSQFEAKYKKLQDEIKPLSRLVAKKKRYAQPEFREFYGKYERWLAGAIVDVREKLNLLNN